MTASKPDISGIIADIPDISFTLDIEGIADIPDN